MASPPAVIVATAGVADAQVTWLVRFCVELSENVPVAVNCWVFPLAIARVGRRHRDRLQRRRRHGQDCRSDDAAERRGDRRRSNPHAGGQALRR